MLTFDSWGYIDWDGASHLIAQGALDDVAHALGYRYSPDYNEACHERPDDVRARLAEL